MSVKLRFKRMGRKKRPFYRLVAIDSRTRRDGREIEKLGWFNPSSVDETFKFNENRVVHWLDQGAIPSLTVKNILGKVGFNHKYHLLRLGKSEDEIDEFVNDKNVLLYTLIKDGWPVGFYMLDYRKKDICDLSFFGLVDEVIGIGLGKYLLQTAILTAWDSKKIMKLTVNTCSLDHKSAIYLYQKYGFTPVKYKDLEKTV